jgi:trigger factor
MGLFGVMGSMQVTETLSEGLKRGFTVVVPAADIEGKRAARLSELGKTLRLPGFRPGKVPVGLVKQRYGSAVQAEVLEESVNEATRQVLEDRGLRAATQPKVDLVSAAESQDKDLEFKVEVELLPEITMPDFAGIELTRLKATPSDESLDRALGEIAARQRTLEPVEEDRGAEKGEILTVDFVGKVDGEPFAGGTGTDMNVEVAGSGFIPGFTEQLEGMKAGETREINVSFPEDYHAADVAGKPATFEITAKTLQKPVSPPVDETLATKIGFENLGELREALSGQMQREYDQLARLKLKRQLLDALAERADFPAPEGMVDAEFEQIWQRVQADLKEGRADEEDRAKDEETLRSEYRAIAERRVKLGLLLSEIGRQNGITVGADELTRAMRAEAQRYPGQEQQVMEFFRKNPQAAETLRGPLFEDKAVDFILELAKVEDKPVSIEELTAAEPAA